jgi:hypothetical protein
MKEAKYPDLDDLAFAPKQADDLADLLGGTGLGYDVIRVRKADAKKLGRLKRIRASVAPLRIFHFIGHGHNRQNGLNLIPCSGRFEDETNLRYMSESLNTDIGAGAKATHVMVILDLCNAGAGLKRLERGDIEHLWIAGAAADQPAFYGWFTKSVITVFKQIENGELADSSGYYPMKKFRAAVERAYNSIKQEEGAAAGVEEELLPNSWFSGKFDSGEDTEAPFFRVPRRINESVKELRALQQVDGGLKYFAETKYFYDRLGRNFTGRTDILRDIGTWRTDKNASCGLQLITGAAGTGKSSIVAANVLTAHPELLSGPEHWDYIRSLDAGFPPNFVNGVVGAVAAVHARQLQTAEIIESIAKQYAEQDPSARPLLDEPNVAGLRNWMYDQPVSPILIIDALDEATSPETTAEVLLRPLLSVRKKRKPICRMLVATRHDTGGLTAITDSLLSEASEPVTHPLDDQDPEVLRRELHDFVSKVLNRAPQWDGGSINAVSQQAAEKLVENPKDMGCGAFLVATLYVEQLKNLRKVPKRLDDLVRDIPVTLPRVLELHLSNIDDDAKRRNQRAVLACLAHTLGNGMSALLVRTLAVNVFHATSDIDVVDILGSSDGVKFYVRMSVDSSGEIIYQLFHKALADHLKNQPFEPGEDRP